MAAPWISPRTRQLLTDRGVGYVDDTGNTTIDLQRPGLVIRTDDPERLAEAGHLLPATSGANVVLAVPYDPIVFPRTQADAGVPLVSVTQIAIDTLTGPGRMPSEGEPVLDWMRRKATKWQYTALQPED